MKTKVTKIVVSVLICVIIFGIGAILTMLLVQSIETTEITENEHIREFLGVTLERMFFNEMSDGSVMVRFEKNPLYNFLPFIGGGLLLLVLIPINYLVRKSLKRDIL